MSSPLPESGPVEHVGRKARRRAAAIEAVEASRKGSGPRFAGLRSLLVVLGVAAAFVTYIALGGHVRSTVLGFACYLSGCSAAGMTTTGWLIVAAPAAVMLVTALFWRKLGRAGRIALGSTAAVVYLVVITFVPGRRRDLSDLIKGPGSDAVADGIMWALGGAGVALLFMLVLVFVAKAVPAVERRYDTVALAGAVALMVAALPVAITKSDPTWVRAAEVFPTELTMNGDRLVRASVGETTGCDGVLPDDALLNKRLCYLTVRASYTTDDSDAVATLRAVLYADDEAADEVRAGLPRGTTPVGVTGEVRTVLSTTYSWVLVGTAGHADGRSVAVDERPWVLWPLRQVSYHFIGVQGGLFIDPDPDDEIRPRTP
ncbi:hypothetical protein [Catellatospora coxensis]|uniref:Uncharacterized protein n=1 Tax=Catellatospora coxensis TaxID=310354 RepID=A0A8J3L5S2_9ACTN|nr:hypothetical protein [Catellatospora coxensis]GIG06930.1 hypothetical protein Cco03nite_36300 [Catellatospora coxensis]